MANIKQITLPNGNTYDIYDATAIHTNDVTALMDLKGSKASYTDLPATGEKGDVWLIANTGEEYVWDGSNWMKLGYDIDASSSTHKHVVSVTGTNESSTVTGTVAVPKVTVGTEYIKATATQGAVTPSKESVLGANTTFTTTVTPSVTNVKAVIGEVAVSGNGTASAITGLGTASTKSALGTDATFSVSGGVASTSKMVTTSVNSASATAVSIPNVTANTAVTASKVSTSDVSIPNVSKSESVTASKVGVTAGKAASWEASVTDGVLSFNWTANTPTAVTANDVTASKVTMGTAIAASKVTAEDVAASKVTLGTALEVSKVTTSAVTVATGSLASTGTGSAVATGVSAVTVSVDNADSVAAVTGYENPSKSTVLTGVKVATQPTIALETGATAGDGVVSVATGIASAATVHKADDNVDAMTSVTVAAPSVTLASQTSSATGAVAVDTVTVTSENKSLANGVAAAQKWTQGTVDVSTPS